MLKYFLLIALSMVSANAFAEDNLPAELQQFEGFSDILPADEYGQSRGPQKISRLQEMIPMIKKQIPETAANNITHAEQVFCYHVAKRTENYTGYTLDGMAITGFGGELDISKTETTYEALFTHSKNILATVAQCHIKPRLILRFTRGVDYTDVLLSSPCPSFTIFYAGRYHSFNVKQDVIDEIIRLLETEKTDFYSPSLLKQTVANAVPTTVEEQEILSKKHDESEPVMNWKEQEEPEEPVQKPTGGWGIKSWRQKK